jgi:hypothetical protein
LTMESELQRICERVREQRSLVYSWLSRLKADQERMRQEILNELKDIKASRKLLLGFIQKQHQVDLVGRHF